MMTTMMMITHSINQKYRTPYVENESEAHNESHPQYTNCVVKAHTVQSVKLTLNK